MGRDPSLGSMPRLMADASTVPIRMGRRRDFFSPSGRSCCSSTMNEGMGPPPTAIELMSILLSGKSDPSYASFFRGVILPV